LLLVVLGTLAFGALGVLLGGSLRADIVLALANVIWFVLLLAGAAGIESSVHDHAGGLLLLLPSGALAEGLYTALGNGTTPLWESAVVLLVWGAVAAAVATRTTKLT
jgi:ABC-2 type transport system permease protein